MTCEQVTDLLPDRVAGRVDLAFTALPHNDSAPSVAILRAAGATQIGMVTEPEA